MFDEKQRDDSLVRVHVVQFSRRLSLFCTRSHRAEPTEGMIYKLASFSCIRKKKDFNERMSPVATSATASAASAKVHSAHAENVHVQSVVQTETQSKISMENTKKINDLMARLGSTHLQVDEYSRKRTEEISEAVAESIKRVVNETQDQQQQLLADANRRTSGKIEMKLRGEYETNIVRF